MAVKMSGTSRGRQRHISPPPPRIKIAKCKLGPWYNVADIFSVTLSKSEVHNALLIFKGAFCAFEPPQQRGVQNALHVMRVRVTD